MKKRRSCVKGYAMNEDEVIKQVHLLTEQVRTLSETQEAMIRRQDQLFKGIGETALKLNQIVETLETTNEALLQSLNENDSNLDDLTSITAALTKVVSDLKTVLPQSMQQQQESGMQAGLNA